MDHPAGELGKGLRVWSSGFLFPASMRAHSRVGSQAEAAAPHYDGIPHAWRPQGLQEGTEGWDRNRDLI